MENVRITDLFDLKHTIAADYLSSFEYPWEALKGISELIISIGSKLDPDEYDNPSENVWIHKTAKVFPSAYIGAPCIIGANTEVRHCAFIRGSALVGENCVVGNSAELKNVIIFDNVQTPHYNYVGDSILGYHAHLGAGSITCNLKVDQKNVSIKDPEEEIETGMRKVGAIVGDNVEIGCNTVLCPGTIVGRGSIVYPSNTVRGVMPEKKIYKDRENVVDKVDN